MDPTVQAVRDSAERFVLRDGPSRKWQARAEKILRDEALRGRLRCEVRRALAAADLPAKELARRLGRNECRMYGSLYALVELLAATQRVCPALARMLVLLAEARAGDAH